MFKVKNKYRVRQHADPRLCSENSFGNNGVFRFLHEGHEINCIASDGGGWEHVSCSLRWNSPPSWAVMCYVKKMFWGKDDTVFQFHPNETKYINVYDNCLHLWRKAESNPELPPSRIV